MVELDDILDKTITEIEGKLKEAQDTATWLKLNDRLLKALALKAKTRLNRGRGKGFNLGTKA